MWAKLQKLLRSASNLQRPQQYTVPNLTVASTCITLLWTQVVHNCIPLRSKWCCTNQKKPSENPGHVTYKEMPVSSKYQLKVNRGNTVPTWSIHFGFTTLSHLLRSTNTKYPNELKGYWKGHWNPPCMCAIVYDLMHCHPDPVQPKISTEEGPTTRIE